jgi:RimJ/RimL family protein N-acetyltransferase
MIATWLTTCSYGRSTRTTSPHAAADHRLRIEASTETGNLAEQRPLEKAGFTREGIARGTTWRNGAWHDTVTYGRLRTDWCPESRN